MLKETFIDQEEKGKISSERDEEIERRRTERQSECERESQPRRVYERQRRSQKERGQITWRQHKKGESGLGEARGVTGIKRN